MRWLLGLLLTAHVLSAQENPSRIMDFNSHAWYFYTGDHQIKGKWGVHLDSQWRRADLAPSAQQFIIRPGVNYSLNDSVMFTLGYAYIDTHPYGDFPNRKNFPEHRIYQQVLLKHKPHNIPVQHRFRMEQRYVRYPQTPDQSWTYQNRFRYFVKADFPLKKRADQSTQWYIPVYDEILIGIAPNYGARPFDQNRLSAGIGYSTKKKVNIEVAYLNQFLGQRNGRIFEFNNTFSITVSSTASLARFFGGD